MKSKNISKLAKANLKVAPGFAAANAEGSMKILALECWRIKKLIPAFADNRRHLVLSTSVNRMTDALTALGVSIEDPEGSEFKDGMTLNVAIFEISDQLEAGRRVVSETLSPTIYIHNKLANAGRVIVTVGGREGEGGP